MSESSEWGFAEGDEIVPGRYALKLLGGGRRYEAYLAWDERLHSLVTAKLVRPSLTDDPGALSGLAGEADMLERTRHPSIVRAFDAVLDGDRPHLVLEFLDGPRLSTLRRRYGVVVEQLLPLALELCSALHYLAAVGIVHLDVKPRNIIMGATPRLIDLSVARTIEAAHRARSPIGTDAYMAPEQCEPARFGEIGPPADVWGLGATLYETLTGTLPFPDEWLDAPDQLGRRYPQTRLTPPPLPARVPDEIAEQVLACLAHDPADRPEASELAAVLDPIAAGLPRPRLGRFRPGSRPAKPLHRAR